MPERPLLARRARRPRAGPPAGRRRGRSVNRLRDFASRIYLVAHQERVDDLQRCLESEGFDVQVVRGPYTAEQSRYSKNLRCLVNHANVWRLVAAARLPALVVEADFVPVRDFGRLPLPFPCADPVNEARFGWLYSGGTILYGFDALGFPHGHGNSTVAYALTPAATPALLEFQDHELRENPRGEYTSWESRIGVHLRWRAGILNYFPIYHYGEHGGRPNLEHGQAGVRGWHQADVLFRPLAFLPGYAEGSQLRFRIVRGRAWLRGVLRLLTLRFFHPGRVNHDSSRGRLAMAGLSVARLLHLAHPYVRALERAGDSRLRTSG